MKFTPQSETQIADGRAERMKLLDPKVPYSFEVFTARDTKSKSSGNDMIELTLNLATEHGARQVRDWITCTQTDKLFEFCRAIGMLKKYHSGLLVADDLVGAEGRCRVAIEKGTANGEGGNYPDRNKIAWYMAPEGAAATASPAPSAAVAGGGGADEDDEIPF